MNDDVPRAFPRLRGLALLAEKRVPGAISVNSTSLVSQASSAYTFDSPVTEWDFWYPVLQNGIGGSCTGFAIAGLFWMNMTHFKMMRCDRACYLWTSQIVTLIAFFSSAYYYANVHVPLAERDLTELVVLGFIFFSSAIPALITSAATRALLMHQIKKIKTFALIVGIGLAAVGYLVTSVCVSLFVSGGPGQRLLIRVVAIPVIMEAQLGLVRLLARKHFHADLNLDRALLFMSPTIVTAGIVGQLLSTSFETLEETIGAAVLLGAVEMAMRLTTLQRDQLYMRLCGARCSALCGRGDAEDTPGVDGKPQQLGASAPGEWRLFASYILLDSASQDVGVAVSLAVNLMFRPPVTPGGASLSSGEVLLRVSIQYLLELVTEMAMPVSLWCAVRVGGMRQWRVSQRQVLDWGRRRSQRWLAPPAQSPAARYRPSTGPLEQKLAAQVGNGQICGSHCFYRATGSCRGGSTSPARQAYFWSCQSLCPEEDHEAVQQTAAELWMEQRADRDALHDPVWLQPTWGILASMSEGAVLSDIEAGQAPSHRTTAMPLVQEHAAGILMVDQRGGSPLASSSSPYAALPRSSSSLSTVSVDSTGQPSRSISLSDDAWNPVNALQPARGGVPPEAAPGKGGVAAVLGHATGSEREGTAQSHAPDPGSLQVSLNTDMQGVDSGRVPSFLLDGEGCVMGGATRAPSLNTKPPPPTKDVYATREAGGIACGKVHMEATALLDDTPALPEHISPAHVHTLAELPRSPHAPMMSAAPAEADVPEIPVSGSEALLVQLELASVRLIRAWDTRFPFFDLTFIVTAFSMTTWLLMSVLFTKQCPYGEPGQPSTWHFDVCQDFV